MLNSKQKWKVVSSNVGIANGLRRRSPPRNLPSIDDNGKETCKTCPADFYSTDRQETCTECPDGYVVDVDPRTACAPCSAGQFEETINAGIRTCKACPNDYYSDAGVATCTVCGAGSVTGADSGCVEPKRTCEIQPLGAVLLPS